jgi:hypothetical protein
MTSKGEDLYPATSEDPYLATTGDFFMATDNQPMPSLLVSVRCWRVITSRDKRRPSAEGQTFKSPAM